MTRPKYLKDVTISIGLPWDWKALAPLSLIYSSVNHHLFRSAPLVHWAVVACHPFRAFHGNSMYHQGHRGWGRSPSSSIITVSWTYLCRKCTLITVLVADHPLHPSTGNSRGSSRLGNTSYMSVALCHGLGYPISVYLPLLSHDASVDVLPATPPTFTHHNMNTALWLYISPGMLVTLLSSVYHTPPLTGYLLPGRGSITSQPPYLHSSTVPLYQKSQLGSQTNLADITGLLMLPVHYPRKNMFRCVVQPFREPPVPPLSLPTTRPSVLPLRPPPH